MPSCWQASTTLSSPAMVCRMSFNLTLACSEPSALSARSGPSDGRPRDIDDLLNRRVVRYAPFLLRLRGMRAAERDAGGRVSSPPGVHPRTGYPLAGRSPPDTASVSPDGTDFNTATALNARTVGV